jgi:hypothetical protein
MQGIKITGNGNTVHKSFADRNSTAGVIVQGRANTVDAVRAADNAAGDGIRVVGNDNSVVGSTANENGMDDGTAGITVKGAGNLVKGNSVFANRGNGISVGGGTAAKPNIVNNNVAGAARRGNFHNGIVLGGPGKGAAGPVDLEGNTAQGNGIAGVKVPGNGHRLKNNVSGGAGTASNGVCQYQVAPGNFNATGNKRGAVSIPGANGSPFPNGCL